MKFEFIPTEDGFGNVKIDAETQPEVAKLAHHFRMFSLDDIPDLLKYADVLKEGRLSFLASNYCLAESYISSEFCDPYRREIERKTGYAGEFPEIDLTNLLPARLCYTHIIFQMVYRDGYISYTVAVPRYDNKDVEYCYKDAEDCVKETFGEGPREPEFKQNRNGHYSKNPNYLKRHPVKPDTKARWFLKVLFDWWLDNRSSNKQRFVVQQYERLNANNKFKKSIVDESGMYYENPLGSISWDRQGRMVSYISWDKFKELK